MTLQTETFDFVSLVRKVGEAALANEEAIEHAVAEMQKVMAALQKTELGFEAQQKSLPQFVSAEVDRKLAQTVDSAASQISARFDDTYQGAERARQSFDDAAERARTVTENAESWLRNNIMWSALGCFALGCVGMILGVWLCAQLFVPPSDILQHRREAEQAVAALSPQGGESALGWCDNQDHSKKRRCVRTDETMNDSPFTSDGGKRTYRIIYGY
jgi:ElaB/YqjD/DUF883 family membrane-anchored ribosome-binding protein